MPADLLAAPKVLLHDHLDGGLRPRTLIEFADRIGHDLPSTDPDQLAAWFVDAAGSGSLGRYLETFSHTLLPCSIPPKPSNQVTAESLLDLAANGVVHTELRQSPTLRTTGELPLEEVVETALAPLPPQISERAVGRERCPETALSITWCVPT